VLVDEQMTLGLGDLATDATPPPPPAKGSSLNNRIGRKESWRREERKDRLWLSG